MRQMHLHLSISELVIVEADSSSTGRHECLDEVEGIYIFQGPFNLNAISMTLLLVLGCLAYLH